VWGVDSGLGREERCRCRSRSNSVASERSWPWEYAPRMAVFVATSEIDGLDWFGRGLVGTAGEG
jgi:hypothetical protein